MKNDSSIIRTSIKSVLVLYNSGGVRAITSSKASSWKLKGRSLILRGSYSLFEEATVHMKRNWIFEEKLSIVNCLLSIMKDALSSAIGYVY